MRIIIDIDEAIDVAILTAEVDGRSYVSVLSESESDRLGLWFDSLDEANFAASSPLP